MYQSENHHSFPSRRPVAATARPAAPYGARNYEDELETTVLQAALETTLDDEDRRRNVTVEARLDLVDLVLTKVDFAAGHWVELLGVNWNNDGSVKAITFALYQRYVPFNVPENMLSGKRRLLGAVVAQLDVQRQKTEGISPNVYTVDFEMNEYWPEYD